MWIVESVPLATLAASLVGLRLLDSYLDLAEIDLVQVAGVSDFLQATLIGAVAVLPMAALLLLGFWAGRFLRVRPRLIIAILCLVPLVWIPLQYAASAAQRDNGSGLWTSLLELLSTLYGYFAASPAGLILLCALPAIGSGLLLRAALARRPEQPRRWWWLFGCVITATLFQAAGPVAVLYNVDHQRSGTAWVEGFPIYRYRLTASAAKQDGVPPACRCGADILWNGERGVAVQCAGQQSIVVVGAQNWVMERQPLWNNKEFQSETGPNLIAVSPDPGVMRFREQTSRDRFFNAILPYQDGQFICRLRDNLTKFDADAKAAPAPKILPTMGGWTANAPALGQDGSLGLRCAGNRLFVNLRHAAIDDEDSFGRRSKSFHFLNRVLGATPTMRTYGFAPQIAMDGSDGIVERMSNFMLDPVVDTIEIDGAIYPIDFIRAFEREQGSFCLYEPSQTTPMQYRGELPPAPVVTRVR